MADATTPGVIFMCPHPALPFWANATSYPHLATALSYEQYWRQWAPLYTCTQEAGCKLNSSRDYTEHEKAQLRAVIGEKP